MSALNRILLIGSVAQAPEVRVSTSGEPFCHVVLQVSRPLRSDGIESGSDLIKVVCWRQVAEQMGKYSEGAQILVEGKIQTRKIEDQGQVKYLTEVEAKEVKAIFLEEKFDSQAPKLKAVKPKVEKPVEKSNGPSFDFEDQSFSSSLPSEFSNDVKEEIPF